MNVFHYLIMQQSYKQEKIINIPEMLPIQYNATLVLQ